MKTKAFSFGPAILVTAAFIGPGTVMTASKSGSDFGFVLLWAVGFSVLATIVLQEMAARLGIVTGSGLSQALKATVTQPLARICVLGLVLVAILVGNAAYQTGNILGAASGVVALRPGSDTPSKMAAVPTSEESSLTNEGSQQSKLNTKNGSEPAKLAQDTVVILIGIAAMLVIGIGRFDVLQMVLTLLVALMSVIFVVAAIMSGPNWADVFGGFVPRIPTGSEWIVIGLIGTTVVPYNLFLHASAAAQRWDFDQETENDIDTLRKTALTSSRWDTILSVLIGGVVTCAIMITAAVAFHAVESTTQADPPAKPVLASVKDVAVQLEPALGSWAKTLFAIGLCAAGLTSAITAPIAAGYAAAGCFGWPGALSDWRLKLTASAVVVAGLLFAIRFGSSPKETIILAQVANGLLLPIIAIFLLVMANRTGLLGRYRNGPIANILGGLVVLMVTLIAARQLTLVGKKIQTLMAPESVEVSVRRIECTQTTRPTQFSGVRRLENRTIAQQDLQ